MHMRVYLYMYRKHWKSVEIMTGSRCTTSLGNVMLFCMSWQKHVQKTTDAWGRFCMLVFLVGMCGGGGAGHTCRHIMSACMSGSDAQTIFHVI